MAQEELAANRTHQAGLESQIKELQTGRASLEQELAKQNQKLQQQEQNLRELQKQQVRQRACYACHKFSHQTQHFCRGLAFCLHDRDVSCV